MSHVLIVDDNDKNLKLVRDVLQAKGHTTAEASSAEDGLKMARCCRPDLILMDIRLPGMSGIDALTILRAEEATKAIPAIAISASVTQHDRKRIGEAGFDGFLEKPIDLRDFLATVNKVLERT